MIGTVEADAILGRMRGAAAPAVSAQIALFNGDPLGAGVELSGGDYSRFTPPTAEWSAPSSVGAGRRVVNSVDWEMSASTSGAWGSATHWALVDGLGARWVGELSAPVTIGSGDRVLIPGGSISLALGYAGLLVPVLGIDAVLAFIGNSYTQNYGGLPDLLEYFLGQRLPGSVVSLGPPPYLATSIANSGTDGWFPGFTLGAAALFPTIDASSSGSTDAVDAVLSVPSDTYDFVVLTSGFRQEVRVGEPGVTISDASAIARVVLPGAGGTSETQYGVVLEVTRRVIAQITAGSEASCIIRMTHEGYNGNIDTDLSDVERTVRLLVLAARQIESEGVAAAIIPEGYVFARLQRGAVGPVGSGVSSPVPAYAALTHSASQQSGNANVAWLHRSQGDVAPFTLNAHQNAIATIVSAWIWGYALWGVDPRGDATFAGDPSGLPSAIGNMISPDGSRIYGGQNAGLGNNPYDTGVNPGGPPDADLDLDWSTETQLQIQTRIVAALDDYYARTTEFD